MEALEATACNLYANALWTATIKRIQGQNLMANCLLIYMFCMSFGPETALLVLQIKTKTRSIILGVPKLRI